MSLIGSSPVLNPLAQKEYNSLIFQQKFNSERDVIALVVGNNKLYAGGSFKNASGIYAKNIAEWNGSSWAALGAGLGNDTAGRGGVSSIVFYQGNICAAIVTSDGQGNPEYYISKWDGTNWSSVAGGPGTGVTFPGYVFALLPLNGYLYAGGEFTGITNLSHLDGVAKWNGTTWSGVGDTTGANFLFALGSYNANLITGGFFTATAGVSTMNVAEYSCATTGVNETDESNSLQVFPNPFSDELSFKLAGSEQTTVSLYNSFGQQILKQAFTNSINVNTVQFASGIYFYELRSNNEIVTNGKVIRQ